MEKNKVDSYKAYFIELPPHAQLAEVNAQKNLELVEALYPHAKDDLIRFTIVSKTNNIRLAEKLASHTKYPKLAMKVYTNFIKGR